MLKNHIILFLILFGQFSVSKAQIPQEFKNFLDTTFQFIEQEVDPVGLAISVKSGDEIWNRTIGISSVQDSLNEESIFPMGSISKTLVSACILSMMEDNELSLQDPISIYLPSYQHIDSNITIIQLLNHTSGLFNFTEHPDYFDIVLDVGQSHLFTQEEIINSFVNAPIFLPGENQIYSNTNYLLLGMIISEISQQPYYEEILQRFDMANNYPSFNIPPYTSDFEELAHLWVEFDTGMTDAHEIGFDYTGLFSTAGAGGAFVAKPKDLVQWGADLYSGNLLSQSSMDSLFNFHPFGFHPSGLPGGYGLGVYKSEFECGVESVGHSGAIFYTSDLQYVPEYDLTILVMTNDGRGLEEIGGVSLIAEELICNYEAFVTSVKEPTTTIDQVTIFPNPTIDEITIESKIPFENEVTVSLYDYKGSLIYETKMESNGRSNLTLNVMHDLPSGIYSIGLFDGKHSSTHKVVKL